MNMLKKCYIDKYNDYIIILFNYVKKKMYFSSYGAFFPMNVIRGFFFRVIFLESFKDMKGYFITSIITSQVHKK